MGSCEYRWRPARAWALAVLVAFAPVALAGCGDEEAPAASDELEVQSGAGDDERASPAGADRSAEESGAREPGGGSGEPGTAALSPEQVAQIRSRIEQRAQRGPERIDDLQGLIEEAADALRDPGTRRELSDGSSRERLEAAEDLCRRSGASEEICEQIGRLGVQGERP